MRGSGFICCVAPHHGCGLTMWVCTRVQVCKTSTQAVVEFLGQYYAPADLTMYQHTYDIKSAMPVRAPRGLCYTWPA